VVPATEWPPARIVKPMPAARAARMDAATSSTSVACAIAAGRRSIAPFQGMRAAS
jgi:hypothetical protein